jgi:DNA-directed RNA polymerase subunit M/transcription elongation factor TFIIS
MEKLRRTRVIVAMSEKLTVWHAKHKDEGAEEVDKISVECPHCGEEAFFLELERSDTAELGIVRKS